MVRVVRTRIPLGPFVQMGDGVGWHRVASGGEARAVAISCPRCGAQLDVTLFAFERAVRCTCGTLVDATRPHAPGPRRRESPQAAELRRRGDAITWTILYGDLPAIDVDLAIAGLRDWVERHLPDRLELFEMVWAARWDRLRAQGWAHRER